MDPVSEPVPHIGRWRVVFESEQIGDGPYPAIDGRAFRNSEDATRYLVDHVRGMSDCSTAIGDVDIVELEGVTHARKEMADQQAPVTVAWIQDGAFVLNLCCDEDWINRHREALLDSVAVDTAASLCGSGSNAAWLRTAQFDVAICRTDTGTDYVGLKRSTGDKIRLPVCAVDDFVWRANNSGYIYDVDMWVDGVPSVTLTDPNGTVILDEEAITEVEGGLAYGGSGSSRAADRCETESVKDPVVEAIREFGKAWEAADWKRLGDVATVDVVKVARDEYLAGATVELPYDGGPEMLSTCLRSPMLIICDILYAPTNGYAFIYGVAVLEEDGRTAIITELIPMGDAG